MPIELPDSPLSRREKYYAGIAGQNVIIPDPLGREEEYLAYIATYGGGGGGSSATLVAIIDQTTPALPTTRPDSTPLVLGDYVKVNSSAVVPFTVSGITFTSVKDQAVWTSTEWLLNANPFQNTAETPVANKTNESLSGTANYQSNVNIENKAAINQAANSGTFAKLSDGKVNLNLKNRLGTDIINESIDNMVFESDAQTLTNKTLSADGNTITDLTGANLKPQTSAEAKKTYVVQSDGTWALGKAGSDVDNTTIEENASDQLQVKDGGITNAKVANSTLEKAKTSTEFWTNNALTGTTTAENITVSGDTTCDDLVVNTSATVPTPTSDTHATTKKYVDDLSKVDDVTIERNANDKMQVKDGGLTVAKMNTSAVATAISASPVDTKLSTEKAVKDYVDGFAKTATLTETDSANVRSATLNIKDNSGNDILNKTLSNFVLSGRKIGTNDLSADITAQQIDDDIKAVTNTYTNKTIDADNNTISNLETDNLKDGVLRTSITGFQTTPDNTHLVSEKLVYDAIEDSKRGFKFTGYVTPNEPTGAIKKDELWYNSSDIVMPTTFPIMVKTYDGTAWGTDLHEYTPTSMELWANKNNDKGYYWFGNDWNIIDNTTDPDNVTINTNTAGQIQIKDGGVTTDKLANTSVVNAKIADATLTKAKASAEFWTDNNLTGTTSMQDAEVANCLTASDAEINTLEVVTTAVVPTPTADTHATTKKYVDDHTIQKAVMPTASADYVGKIYQYIGATDVDFTNGFFYICIEDTTTTPTSYKWLRKTVQNDSVDGTTINRNASDELQIKDAGVSTAKVADEAITKAKIAISAKVVYEDDTQTITNKTVDADNNTISNLELDNLKSGVLDTTSLTNDNNHIASSKLITTKLDDKQDKSNLVTAFQATVDDTHYPSEKLVKDSLDTKINKTDITYDSTTGIITFNY